MTKGRNAEASWRTRQRQNLVKKKKIQVDPVELFITP